MNRDSKIALITVTLTLVLGSVACKKSETTTSTQVTTTESATTATTATVAPQPVPATATTATTATAAPATGSIANAEGEISGARIDVTELKRASGGTVNLKFTITNNSPKAFSFSGHYLGDNQVSKDSYYGVSGIHLVDPVNKKKYFVVTDAEKNCLCSKNIDDIPPGQRTSLWAKFPAPPPEVQKVTVEVPHFQPMDDVPIAQ